MSDIPPPAKLRSQEPKFWGSFLTSVFLAAILATGPLLLGGFRIWIALPILGAAGALILFQGFRLFFNAPRLVGRFGDSIDACVALFLIYAGFRYVTTPVEFLARLEVLHIYAFAGIFWTCRYGFSRRPHVLYLLGAIVVVGLLVTAAGFLFRFRPELRPYAQDVLKEYMPRFCGTYGCPNHFGEFLIMTFGILFSYCLFYRSQWISRIVAFYLAGMMVVAIIFSLSRGSWLALIASLLAMGFFLVRHGKLRWYWIAGALAVAMAGAFVLYTCSFQVQQRIEELCHYGEKGDWDNYVRVALARDAIKIWNDAPLLGTGPGTFLHMHPRYQSSTYSTLAQYTHNDYLNLLADYGLIGAVIALAFIVCTSRQLFRSLGPLPDSDEAVMLASALCAWCAMLVHSTVDFNLHIYANAYVFFALIGLGLRLSAATASTHPGWLPKSGAARPLAVLVAIAGGVIIYATIYTARGYYPYYFASEKYGTRPVPAALLAGQEAVKADPKSPIALRYLGDLYRNRAAAEIDFTKRAASAQQAALLYAQGVKVNPLDDELLALQGLSYDFMGRYAEAYIIHTTVIKRQPYSGYFRLLLGLHFWRRNMLPEAQKAFEVGAKCPNTSRENEQALNEINRVLGERKVQEQLPPPVDHTPTIP